VEEIVGTGDTAPTGHIPFTPRAKKVLELSLREALQLGHHYIGSEHILLGLIREGRGVAAQVLVQRGIGLDRARAAVLAHVAQHGGEQSLSDPHQHTPAAEEVITAAQQLAGGLPVGSHHLLEALARSEGSLAAKALAAAGVDPDALASIVDELGVEGTTDLTPEEAAMRQMEVRVEGDELHVVVRDEDTVAKARALLEQLDQPVLRGDDPVAGPMVATWRELSRYLAAAEARLAPVVEGEGASRRGANVVQRAIQSRLRRRRPDG
jgi:ATP-dependent Clp protease ATP-binding subunit ClpC